MERWLTNATGAEDIIFQDVVFEQLGRAPFIINQCYSNVGKIDCNTSKFEVGNVRYSNITGTTEGSRVAEFQCSEAQNGCKGLVFAGIDVKNMNGESITGVRCSNVLNPEGFQCG